MSQTELANQMRLRGHRWVQQTVVAVEKGERSLRLSEAFDLTQILRVARVEDLGSQNAFGNAATVAWLKMDELERDLAQAARRFYGGQAALARATLDAHTHENAYMDGVLNTLRRTAADVVTSKAAPADSLVEDIDEIARRYGEY